MLRRNILLLALGSQACLSDVYIIRNGGQDGSIAPPPDAGPMADTGQPTLPPIENSGDVLNLFEGRTMIMSAPSVPTHPMGYDENVNFGQATQCINQVTMQVTSGTFRVSTTLGTLEGAPNPEEVGTCDRNAPNGSDLVFDTTAALIENVEPGGGCFDITLTYAGFGQEGRGAISEDQQTVYLELFFRDQALGHRCADGVVGDSSVMLNQEPFGGNAVQTYSFSN